MKAENRIQFTEVQYGLKQFREVGAVGLIIMFSIIGAGSGKIREAATAGDLT